MLSFLLILSFSKVVVLTDKNFTSTVENPNRVPLFVKFWVTWCEHCREFAPTWENFSEYNLNITVAEIECESNKNTCKEFASGGYPQLKWFDPGNSTPIPYTSGRSIRYLTQFTNKQPHAPLQFIEFTDIGKMVNDNKITSNFIFTFNGTEDQEITTIKQIATNLREYPINFFAIYNETADLSLMIYNGNTFPIVYNGNWSLNDVKIFIIDHAFPVFSNLSGIVAQFYLDYKSPFLAFISNEDMTDLSLTIASNLSYSMPIVTAYCERIQYFCRYTGADKGKVRFVVWNKSKRLFWTLGDDTDINEANVWIKSVKDGTLPGKGPGDGIFSRITSYYYDSYAEGVHQFAQAILLPPLVVITVIIMILDAKGKIRTKNIPQEKPKTE
ncbi:Thioredoxin family protein [Trichomonas vaginalis G3]|uniref:Thioredoxin family protein n=1 Tax=Trichomonas vaginalis (strain ATCC PRA-98 / G3) TaxID=412133 RepID=A2F420_TRIV3|nr:cell redox homeostasis [Trichomonas vaginalis G3]EAY00374.1 Thioredoxin family protein [Trichomonas vaginalis G3]KAI5552359.1 cell redox homeostasis [Trichomonas vaginalis G3]|eukprot:XP_001313303.1 Thioredoxin family protein [Trichomonas vaginalis G3]